MYSEEAWTTDHENRLREHVSRLKAERSNIQGTYVTLESTQVENIPVRPSSSQEARKLDLEMAVLMQVYIKILLIYFEIYDLISYRNLWVYGKTRLN